MTDTAPPIRPKRCRTDTVAPFPSLRTYHGTIHLATLLPFAGQKIILVECGEWDFRWWPPQSVQGGFCQRNRFHHNWLKKNPMGFLVGGWVKTGLRSENQVYLKATTGPVLFFCAASKRVVVYWSCPHLIWRPPLFRVLLKNAKSFSTNGKFEI